MTSSRKCRQSPWLCRGGESGWTEFFGDVSSTTYVRIRICMIYSFFVKPTVWCILGIRLTGLSPFARKIHSTYDAVRQILVFLSYSYVKSHLGYLLFVNQFLSVVPPPKKKRFLNQLQADRGFATSWLQHSDEDGISTNRIIYSTLVLTLSWCTHKLSSSRQIIFM